MNTNLKNLTEGPDENLEAYLGNVTIDNFKEDLHAYAELFSAMSVMVLQESEDLSNKIKGTTNA